MQKIYKGQNYVEKEQSDFRTYYKVNSNLDSVAFM